MEDTERFFSVELRAKASLKNVIMTNGTRDSALVEGTIGKLVRATFAEGEVLEVVGEKGVLRINLREEEVTKATAAQTGVKGT
jgi:hypothetical protein